MRFVEKDATRDHCEEGREGGASAAAVAAGKRLDRYSFASLAHSSFGGESWVATRRMEGSAEARAAGEGRRDSQISFGVGRVNVADYQEKFQDHNAAIEWRQTIQFSGHWVEWTIRVSAGRNLVSSV